MIQEDKSGTIATNNDQFLCIALDRAAYNQGKNATDIVLIPAEIVLRRLTPTECARLQGMPDWWCDDVPHSDSAEYKMWGNGMALPCVMYVMEGIAQKLKEMNDNG